MGMAGKRVTHPKDIQSAVTEALALGAPYVLEVMLEELVPAQ
jgi:thiamine pyrophosphate-dependent acetolactate synthase large subunit-like protein